MGRSEYGILLKNITDFKNLLDVIKKHNEQKWPEDISEEDDTFGEKLEFGCILDFNGKIYACLGNGGGRTATCRFFTKNWNEPILEPFDKPEGWFECEKYLWKNDQQQDPLTILEEYFGK